MKRAVADRCIQRFRFEDGIEQVPQEEVHITSSKVSSPAAFLKPVGELSGQVDTVKIRVGVPLANFSQQGTVRTTFIDDSSRSNRFANIEILESDDLIHPSGV